MSLPRQPSSAEAGTQRTTAANPFAATITAEEFGAACRTYASGVTVIAAESADGPVGLTTTSIDRFADTPQWIRGRVVSTVDAGGSTSIAVQALQAGAAGCPTTDTAGDRPLVYHYRTWHALGEHSQL